MKPIPTLYKPLQSVDIETKEPFKASVERSDSCAVPAASVVAEHVIAWEIANAINYYSLLFRVRYKKLLIPMSEWLIRIAKPTYSSKQLTYSMYYH